MQKPIISAIAAISSKNRSLGKDNSLLWKIPEDMKHFKEITTGHPIIMGRKTFESFGARPLPKRQNIVITRNETLKFPDAHIVHNFEEALETARQFNSDEIFIIGGQQIYETALPYIDRLYLTIVYDELDGDVFFPEYSEFKKVISKTESKDSNYKYDFVVLER